MAIIVGKGKAARRIDGPLADGYEAELREALGPIAVELDRVSAEILSAARAQWPVRSGNSRDAWRVDLRVQPGVYAVEAFLNNPNDYVRYIRSTKVGRKNDATRIRSPLVTLVRVPAREREKELKRVLPGIVAAAMGLSNG